MGQNEINNSNKTKLFILTLLVLLVSVAGISYAYFTIQVVGNETASSMRLRTANMSLIYNDVQIVSGEYATPGWTDTKTLTVTNTGNVTANYTIIWRDLYNEVINGELVISATCSSSSGSCSVISETAVPTRLTESTGAAVKANISIAPGVTHTYTLTVLFKETGSNQNYNQNKEFYGTLNIAEATEIRRNGTDSRTGLPVVKIGATEEFLDLTNAINYTNLVNTNGNIYNYASGKSVLLAKYNLYVGEVYNVDADTYTLISSSANGYGLQSEEAKGYLVNGGSSRQAVGVVPFCGSNTIYGYWNDAPTSTIKARYGTSYTKNNIYDAAYVSPPNYSVAFRNSVENANYSIAYYVEEYVDRLGIEGTGRLLTYTEVNAMTRAQRTSNTSYWLGSAEEPDTLWINNFENVWNEYTIADSGDIYLSQPAYYWKREHSGVRPVIVVNTSDIQSN